MRRVMIFALLCGAFLALDRRSAMAVAEFCPATLTYKHVENTPALQRRQSAVDSVGASTAQVASLFGFELSAYGPRTITAATLAFDTSGGWFTAAVPQVTLIEKDRHYTSASASFTQHDWITPLMYVRFPADVTIAHAWVYDISVTGDDLFDWSTRGTVKCPPPATASKDQQRAQARLPQGRDWLDPKDADHLDVPPGPSSAILRAASSNALGDSNCAEPFRDAEVTLQAQPNYPDFMRGAFNGLAQSAVQVALLPDGSLRDAWIWGPSGYKMFDDSALNAARASKYSGARAYCQAVPAEYFFRVTYDSNA